MHVLILPDSNVMIFQTIITHTIPLILINVKDLNELVKTIEKLVAVS